MTSSSSIPDDLRFHTALRILSTTLGFRLWSLNSGGYRQKSMQSSIRATRKWLIDTQVGPRSNASAHKLVHQIQKRRVGDKCLIISYHPGKRNLNQHRHRFSLTHRNWFNFTKPVMLYQKLKSFHLWAVKHVRHLDAEREVIVGGASILHRIFINRVFDIDEFFEDPWMGNGIIGHDRLVTKNKE